MFVSINFFCYFQLIIITWRFFDQPPMNLIINFGIQTFHSFTIQRIYARRNHQKLSILRVTNFNWTHSTPRIFNMHRKIFTISTAHEFNVLSYFCSHEAITIIVFFIIIIMIVVISLATSAVRPNRAQPMENRCPNDAQPSDPTSEKLHAIVIKSVLRMSFIVVFFTTPFFYVAVAWHREKIVDKCGPWVVNNLLPQIQLRRDAFSWDNNKRCAIDVCWHQRPPIIHWHSRAATGDNVQLVSRVCWHLFAHFTN